MRDEEKTRLLRSWQAVAGLDTDQSWNDIECLAGLFQRLPPDSLGVAAILEPLPHGSAVLGRIRRCYRECEVGAYFIPRSRDARPETIEPLATSHFESMRHIMVAAGYPAEASEMARTPVAVVVLDDLENGQPRTETPPYDALGDWVVEDFESPWWLLGEAFYSVAASYPLSYWMRWPALADLNPLAHPDPFASFAELYFRGHWPRIEHNTVFLEPTTAASNP